LALTIFVTISKTVHQEWRQTRQLPRFKLYTWASF